MGAGIAMGRMTLALIRAGDQLQYTVLGELIRRAHGLRSLSDELKSSPLLDAESAYSVGDLVVTQRRVAAKGVEAYFLGAP